MHGLGEVVHGLDDGGLPGGNQLRGGDGLPRRRGHGQGGDDRATGGRGRSSRGRRGAAAPDAHAEAARPLLGHLVVARVEVLLPLCQSLLQEGRVSAAAGAASDRVGTPCSWDSPGGALRILCPELLLLPPLYGHLVLLGLGLVRGRRGWGHLSALALHGDEGGGGGALDGRGQESPG